MMGRVPRPPDLVPDDFKLPLKDALRAVRYSMRRSRSFLPEPERTGLPFAGLAGYALRGADRVMNSAMDVASGMARSILETPRPDDRRLGLPQDLDALIDGADTATLAEEIGVTDGLYNLLRFILLRLGAADALVYEHAIRQACREAALAARDADDATHQRAFVADLMLALEKREAIAEVAWAKGGDTALSADDLSRAAVFALGLALVAGGQSRAASEDPVTTLEAACTLTLALLDDVRRGYDDRMALRALLDAYGDKV